MSLKEWNSIIELADYLTANIISKGLNANWKSYNSSSDTKSKGIAINLLDGRGKIFTTMYSGTSNDFNTLETGLLANYNRLLNEYIG